MHRVYYCNGCGKLYMIFDGIEEVVRIGKPVRVHARRCLHCQLIWSQFLSETHDSESKILWNAQQILQKNKSQDLPFRFSCRKLCPHYETGSCITCTQNPRYGNHFTKRKKDS